MLSSKKWNNKTSDLKLVYLYSTIKMMHGPINLSAICICPMNIHLICFYYVYIFMEFSPVLIAVNYCDRRNVSPAASVIVTQAMVPFIVVSCPDLKLFCPYFFHSSSLLLLCIFTLCTNVFPVLNLLRRKFLLLVLWRPNLSRSATDGLYVLKSNKKEKEEEKKKKKKKKKKREEEED